MSTILDERSKVRYEVEEDVSDVIDDVRLLLTLVEEVGESNVDGVDLEDVPENLGDEIFPTSFRDDVLTPKWFDPELSIRM